MSQNLVQVEVCVQNGFESGAAAPAEIAESTWEQWFQRWLEMLEPDDSPIGLYELSLRLTDDREIQTLNAQYRQQDKPTDVLAFAALEAETPQSAEMPEHVPVYLGDIVISVETAQQQAASRGHSVEIELAWLASHGLLHLLGWDHPDEESLIQMLDQQQVLLHGVGLPGETR